MAFLTALIEVILPVVLVALVGVALARKFQLDMGTVGKINLYGLTPLLAFDSVMKTEVSGGQAIQLVGGYLLITLVAGLIAWLAAWGRDGPTRRAMIASVVIGNNGNFGLPIALLALGRVGLDQAVVIFVTSLVVMYTVGPALLGSHGGLWDAVLTVVRLPVTWALLAGLIVRTTGVVLPVGVARGAELLAQAAIPMVLIALGLQLGQRSSLRLTAPVVIAAGVRVVALPVLAAGLGLLLRLDGPELSSLILASAMPTAVNAFMLAREYGSNPALVASVVALSTLASLGTIAGVVALLPLLA
ncbi:MAG: AEC family transporter [Micropruina sp.]|uniref:AEC family transporter n=1 Tax=Micropruina sp. TaxID=2737536 RepID=UPI0039E2BAAA